MNTDNAQPATGTDTVEAAAPSAEMRLQAVLLRLEQSRDVMRRHLLPDAQEAADAARQQQDSPWRHPLRNFRRLRRLAGRWEVSKLAVQAVERWWKHQPWHDSSELLAGTVALRARPLVKRYPLAAVVAAATVGAVIVAGRPWRWTFVRRQLRPVPGQLTRWAVAQLATAPMQTALAGLLLKSLLGDGPDGAASRASTESNTHPNPGPSTAANAESAESVDSADSPGIQPTVSRATTTSPSSYYAH